MVFPQAKYIKDMEEIAEGHYADGNYNLALKKYLDLIKEDETSAKYNYKVGLCYILGSFQNKKAIPYLEKALKANYKEDAKYYAAMAYLNNYQFTKAINLLDEFSKTVDIESDLVKKSARLKEMCNNAIVLMKSPVNVKFGVVEGINSTKDDYNAFMNNEENFIILSANKKYDPDFETYSTNVYTSVIGEDGKWTFPAPVKKINTYDNEEINFMSKDGKYLYIRNSFQDDYSIMLCGLQKGTSINLDEANPLNKLIKNGKFQYGVSTNEDNSIVYFSSKVEDNYNIYLIKKLPNGEWSDIEKLSDVVNSSYDEVLPVIFPDGKTMYFASEGFNSMGGLDIFVTKLDDNTGKWSKPKNLGYPINSTDDDYTISFYNNNSNALLSTIREGGKGGRDIYKITFPDVDPQMSVVKLMLKKGSGENPPNITDDLQVEVKVYDASNNLHSSFTSNTSTGNVIVALPVGKYTLKIDTFGDYPLNEVNTEIKAGEEFQFKYDVSVFMK
jgi:tetratricopeptide (TPR) repeat protein